VRVDRQAIGAAGQHAILDLLVGMEFAGQEPADHAQHHGHDERDQPPVGRLTAIAPERRAFVHGEFRHHRNAAISIVL
jgi:hypothetical protein